MGFIMTFVIFTSPKVSSQLLISFTTLDAILQLSRHWSEWHRQFEDILHWSFEEFLEGSIEGEFFFIHPNWL
jgi:hypothetical protein